MDMHQSHYIIQKIMKPDQLVEILKSPQQFVRLS